MLRQAAKRQLTLNLKYYKRITNCIRSSSSKKLRTQGLYNEKWPNKLWRSENALQTSLHDYQSYQYFRRSACVVDRCANYYKKNCSSFSHGQLPFGDLSQFILYISFYSRAHLNDSKGFDLPPKLEHYCCQLASQTYIELTKGINSWIFSQWAVNK